MKQEIVYPELSYTLVGILFEAHNQLGRSKSERQYGDLVEKLLREAHINYEREKILPESFEGEQKGRNKIDFLIDDKIVLEIKAKRMIVRDDYFQTMRYLQALNKRLGILVNFRQRYLAPRRILQGYHS